MSATEPQTKTPLWQAALLIFIGIVFAVAMLLFALSLFPNLIPDNQTRTNANQTLEVTFRYTDGDMWVHQPGRIRMPEEDVVLGQWTLAWDANSFRVPAMTADHYPIVAFGDSFTEATTVATPWTDTLANILETPVGNYGYRGYGPLEYAAVAEQYAAGADRSWILYAHFSGNDLYNANQSLEDVEDRSAINQLGWLVRQAGENIDIRSAEIVECTDTCDYPMAVIIGGSYYEMAFLEDLLWWQVAPEGGFLGTETFNVIGDSLDTIRDVTDPDACRAVIFVPSKEQIYYPYIHPAARQYFDVAFRETVINGSNQVVLRDADLARDDVESYIARLGEQRDAMRELAAQHDWLFIDLLPAFQEAALQEQLLYYRYDGHWNQAGHDLAAQVIADFMQNAPNCPLTSP